MQSKLTKAELKRRISSLKTLEQKEANQYRQIHINKYEAQLK